MTIRLAKPTVFTIWPFTGKVCVSCPRILLLGVSEVGDVDVHVHCGRSFRTAYSLDHPSYEWRNISSSLSEEMKNVHYSLKFKANSEPIM